MISEDVCRTVLELPLEDRLELARRLVERRLARAMNDAVTEDIRRIEDLAAGRPTA